MVKELINIRSIPSYRFPIKKILEYKQMVYLNILNYNKFKK